MRVRDGIKGFFYSELDYECLIYVLLSVFLRFYLTYILLFRILAAAYPTASIEGRFMFLLDVIYYSFADYLSYYFGFYAVVFESLIGVVSFYFF